MLAVVRGEHPEPAGAAGASDIGGQPADQIHVSVAGEEAGMQREAGLLPGAERLSMPGQRPLDERARFFPMARVVRLASAASTTSNRRQSFPPRVQTFEEEFVEVAGVQIEPGGQLFAGAFEFRGIDGENEVAALVPRWRRRFSISAASAISGSVSAEAWRVYRV